MSLFRKLLHPGVVFFYAFTCMTACNNGANSKATTLSNEGSSTQNAPQHLDPLKIVRLESSFAVKIPEANFATLNPEHLRVVDENSLNKSVMPVIARLSFFSHEKQRYVPINFEKIENNCFARRTAIDAYLWFGEQLRAKQEVRIEPDHLNPFVKDATITKHRYLLPGFERSDFKTKAWVETARIKVLGRLKAGDVEWKEHEAVVVNTQSGIRVIDPSFEKTKALTLDEWFKFFAPQGKCTVLNSLEDASRIVQAIVMSTSFKQSWPTDVPLCGYSFHQRLNAVDLQTNTGWSFGNSQEELFLSSKFRTYFEEVLLQ